MSQKGAKNFLAFDLGGTKLAVAVVSAQGKVLDHVREPVRVQKGAKSLVKQMAELARPFIEKHALASTVGVASAGPLDPRKGVLLDPTNFSRPGEELGFKRFELARELSRELQKEFAKPKQKVGKAARRPSTKASKARPKAVPVTVVVENDAAAAALAEDWIGGARRVKNSMILTLGTGLGTAVIANGALVRAGRGLHTEAGHMIINWDDTQAVCGCGRAGCAEAYLSGRSFEKRAQESAPQWRGLSAEQMAEKARAGDVEAQFLFDEYAHYLAIALHNFTVMFCPEVVLFAGSFALASDLFLPETRRRLEEMLARRNLAMKLTPKLEVSKLKNQSGVLGAARIAIERQSERTRA